MLTKKNPDGTWSVQGVDFKDCTGDIYGALCKLRDYEKTGLEPSDFRSNSYEKLYLYKVYCTDDFGMKIIYCKTEEEAKKMVELLKQAGYDAHMNIWSWQGFIEK